MSTIMNASGVTFPDATTQTSAAMPFTGSWFTGQVHAPNLNVYNGTVWNGTATGSQKNIKQWYHQWSQPQNTTVNILRNTVAWQDVPFFLTVVSFQSSIGYQTYTGTFGGYGLSQSVTGSGNPNFTLSCTTSAGIGTLRLSCPTMTLSPAGVYGSMIIYGPQGVTPIIGSIRE